MLLEIDNLRIVSAGGVELVAGASLAVERGRTAALVGESGSGKSLTALAILGLLPAGLRVESGSIRFDGREITTLFEREMRRLRGDRIAMVFQEPMSSLNPVLSAGEQIAEPLRLHRGLSRRAAGERATELLSRVGIPEAGRRARQFPHEMSGGMRQRVMIAMAIACEPALLIADEPTTALDVTIQAQVTELLRELQRSMGMGILFITHDLPLVGRIADDVSVMYSGRIVEQLPGSRLLIDPSHPYTRALLRSLPGRVEADSVARGRLPVIPGEVARPHQRPRGCAFHTRCDEAAGLADCSARVPLLIDAGAGRRQACWRR